MASSAVFAPMSMAENVVLPGSVQEVKFLVAGHLLQFGNSRDVACLGHNEVTVRSLAVEKDEAHPFLALAVAGKQNPVA